MVRAFFASLAVAAAATAPTKNIVELAESVPALSTLVAAVVAGDLADTLSSHGPFTVFAPTNDAFGALPAGTLDSLMKPENKDQLVDILTYHVLADQVLSKDLKAFQRVPTVEGKDVLVFSDTRGVRVSPDGKDFKTVSAADNLATNGVAHIIDGVLLPPAAKLPNIVELAQSLPTLSTLVTAVVAADLADTLSSPGPFTVFAPTNDAFGALPDGTLDSLLKPENKDQLVDVLTYHVLPEEILSTSVEHQTYSKKTVEGKSLQLKSSKTGFSVGSRDVAECEFFKVASADNVAKNGIVHVIPGVLLPPLPNIVELAESVKELSTLVSAVVAGDLVDTLSDKAGAFTVFAPTNDAFGALPAGTLDDLMKPENKAQLVDILTFHVLPQKAFAKDLDLFQALTTVEGKPLHVQKWGGVVRVGASLTSADLKTVTGPDNEASNGIVHVIDGVLLPPSEDIV